MNEMEPIFTSKLIQACVTCMRIIDNYVIAGKVIIFVDNSAQP